MHTRLLNRVHQAHDEFLQSNSIPQVSDRASLRVWHHQFPLESVPDIVAKSFHEVSLSNKPRLSVMERLELSIPNRPPAPLLPSRPIPTPGVALILIIIFLS